MGKIGRIENLMDVDYVIGNTTIPAGATGIIFRNKTVVADPAACGQMITSIQEPVGGPDIAVRSLFDDTVLTVNEIQNYCASIQSDLGASELCCSSKEGYYWDVRTGVDLNDGMTERLRVFDFSGAGVTQTVGVVMNTIKPAMDYLLAGRIEWAVAELDLISAAGDSDFLSTANLAYFRMIMVSACNGADIPMAEASSSGLTEAQTAQLAGKLERVDNGTWEFAQEGVTYWDILPGIGKVKCLRFGSVSSGDHLVNPATVLYDYLIYCTYGGDPHVVRGYSSLASIKNEDDYTRIQIYEGSCQSIEGGFVWYE